jgi:hypothetical protein
MMSYLDEIGDRIRSRVPSDGLPTGDLDALFRLYALLALAKGDAVTAADVHDAWTAWMQQQGIVEHAALQPFEQLDNATRAEDDPFVAAIHATSQELPARTP